MRKVKIGWSVVLFSVLLICCVDTAFGKRAFAIRMRSKNPGNSGLSRYSRKNYHQAHMSDNVSGGMVRNPPVPDAQPAKGAGWNVDSAGPVGPPPAYSSLGHHAVPVGGAPPAYSRINPPSYAEAMGYSSHRHNSYGSVASSGRHYDYNANHNNLQSPYMDNTVGSYGSSYGYHRGSNPFSMGNILTGVALWQVGHGLAHSGNHHYHHYNEHKQETKDKLTSTLAPEVENSHIQVNADFDFGPSPAAAIEPIRKS